MPLAVFYGQDRGSCGDAPEQRDVDRFPEGSGGDALDAVEHGNATRGAQAAMNIAFFFQRLEM